LNTKTEKVFIHKSKEDIPNERNENEKKKGEMGLAEWSSTI
jgi:hypothetical protein